MITLSKGYKKPETGDLGSVWFQALEDNIVQLNDHTHNGVDAAPIQTIDLSTSNSKVTVNSGDFVNQLNGYWRATVSIPGFGGVDNYVITAKDPTTKEIVYLRIEKLSTTQIYVYTNAVQNFELYIGV